jgi:hypothetical protein
MIIPSHTNVINSFKMMIRFGKELNVFFVYYRLCNKIGKWGVVSTVPENKGFIILKPIERYSITDLLAL